MVTALEIIKIVATLAASLACSCLGLVALARFAIALWSARRRDLFESSPDGDGAFRRQARDRFRVLAELFALLIASASLLWLSYALALLGFAPAR